VQPFSSFIHSAALPFEQNADLADRDVFNVTWFYKMMTQVAQFLMRPKPHIHQECVAVSNACLHLSYSGLFTSPTLNMCPVSNPVIILSWFVIRLNNSSPFFAEGFFKKTHSPPNAD
jgi:hypothetical protein